MTPRSGHNKILTGKARRNFAWFNVLKSLRDSAAAHAMRVAAQAAGLRLLYHLLFLSATGKFPFKTRVFS